MTFTYCVCHYHNDIVLHFVSYGALHCTMAILPKKINVNLRNLKFYWYTQQISSFLMKSRWNKRMKRFWSTFVITSKQWILSFFIWILHKYFIDISFNFLCVYEGSYKCRESALCKINIERAHINSGSKIVYRKQIPWASICIKNTVATASCFLT